MKKDDLLDKIMENKPFFLVEKWYYSQKIDDLSKKSFLVDDLSKKSKKLKMIQKTFNFD